MSNIKYHIQGANFSDSINKDTINHVATHLNDNGVSVYNMLPKYYNIQKELKDNYIDSVKKQPKYETIQCIGFEIGTSSNNDSYRALRNEEADARGRCKVMKEAIEKAESSNQIDRDSKCMKVFMAPEFFFRGNDGGYKMETADMVAKYLQDITNDPKYKDWLFVFGTIVSYSKGLDQNGDDFFEAYNYSLIHKGFTDNSDSRIVMKENKSSIDYVGDIHSDRSKLYHSNTKHLIPLNPVHKRSEEKIKNYDGNALFEIDGIRFGVEICKDNIMRRIDSAKSPIKKFDVQLVPSSGVGKLRVSRNLKRNGIGFVCDGLSDTGGSYCQDFDSNKIESLSKIPFNPSGMWSLRKFFCCTKSNIHIFETHSLRKNKDRQIERSISL